MKNKLLKKTAYLIAAVGLGSTLLLGNAYAKQDNPTEIVINAIKDGHVETLREGEPLYLNTSGYLNLLITAYDEDGIESHSANIMYHKHDRSGIHPRGDGINLSRSEDGKQSRIDFNLIPPYERDGLQVITVVKDKLGNTTRKTLDVYFE